jgi:hypothetical protein
VFLTAVGVVADAVQCNGGGCFPAMRFRAIKCDFNALNTGLAGMMAASSAFKYRKSVGSRPVSLLETPEFNIQVKAQQQYILRLPALSSAGDFDRKPNEP